MIFFFTITIIIIYIESELDVNNNKRPQCNTLRAVNVFGPFNESHETRTQCSV